MDREMTGSLVIMLVAERLPTCYPKGISAGIANTALQNLYNDSTEGKDFLRFYFRGEPDDQLLDYAFARAKKAGLAKRSLAGEKKRTPVFSLTEKGGIAARDEAVKLTGLTLVAILDALLGDHYRKLARRRKIPRTR